MVVWVGVYLEKHSVVWVQKSWEFMNTNYNSLTATSLMSQSPLEVLPDITRASFFQLHCFQPTSPTQVLSLGLPYHKEGPPIQGFLSPNWAFGLLDIEQVLNQELF